MTGGEGDRGPPSNRTIRGIKGDSGEKGVTGSHGSKGDSFGLIAKVIEQQSIFEFFLSEGF